MKISIPMRFDDVRLEAEVKPYYDREECLVEGLSKVKLSYHGFRLDVSVFVLEQAIVEVKKHLAGLPVHRGEAAVKESSPIGTAKNINLEIEVHPQFPDMDSGCYLCGWPREKHLGGWCPEGPHKVGQEAGQKVEFLCVECGKPTEAPGICVGYSPSWDLCLACVEAQRGRSNDQV